MTKKLLLPALLFSFYSVVAQETDRTFVPDDYFEQALIDLGYDDVLDDYVLTTNIIDVTEIDLFKASRNIRSNVEDLRGIEEFIALKKLKLFSLKSLSTLDITNNKNLEYLDISETRITNIRLVQNKKLKSFYASDTPLDLVVVSQNPALEILFLERLPLERIYLGGNRNLKELTIRGSNITEIDVSNNTLLTVLSVEDTSISGINLSKNVSLEFLELSGNTLYSLNLTNNTTLKSLNASNNPLTCIQVADVDAPNQWQATYIDDDDFFSTNCNNISDEFTFVPDDVFEQNLIDKGYDDVLDDYVASANISQITALDISNDAIFSLEGIEGFTSLRKLNCLGTFIRTLDVSQNPDLEDINVFDCKLSELDFSNNLKLKVINADMNILTSIDVTKNLALEELSIITNLISEIDLSNNVALKDLGVTRNSIRELNLSNQIHLEILRARKNNINQIDLSNNISLKELYLSENILSSLDLTSNTDLSSLFTDENPLDCIQVADEIQANQIPLKNIGQATFSTTCSNTSTTVYVPDDNFEQALIDVGYDDVPDNYVTVVNIELIKELDIARKEISDLTGIEAFSGLGSLDLANNNLQNIDISNLTRLKFLRVRNNNLAQLDISKNKELKILEANSNINLLKLDVSENLKLEQLRIGSTQINSIDVTNNIALVSFSISDTKLTMLDVSKNTQLNSFSASNNPFLNCIQVADVDAANAAVSRFRWFKDDTTQYSLNCSANNICTSSGTILMERYERINGSAVSDLIEAAYYYPLRPSLITELSSFEIPRNQLDKYGVRVSGYLCPPETGTYYFYIAGNNHTELSLSTTENPANKVRIAHHESWASNRQWDKFTTQKSQGIRLEKGRRYYIEALMKEDTSGDNLAVGWRKPSEGDGTLASEVIPGSVLSPSLKDYISVTGISISPTELTISEDEATQLTASVSPSDATYRRSIVWSTSDASIVSVDNFGHIKGLSQGTATITVKANDGGFTAQTDITVVAGNQKPCTASGSILMERYDDIGGLAVSDLLNATNYPDNPSSSSELSIFEIPKNQGDNYGVRVSGYLCPPETGTYNFWIAGNNNTELNLSTTSDKADKVRIAYHDTYVNNRQWTKFDTQRSEGIYLIKGNRYYIEALMKEAVAGDNLAVAWRKPSDFVNLFPTEVIPGGVLSPFENSSKSLSIRASDLPDPNDSNLTISPNPASTEVNIVVRDFEAAVEIEYMIYTFSGIEVKSLKGYSRQTIDISGLAKGTYLLVARSGSWMKGQKLIVR